MLLTLSISRPVNMVTSPRSLTTEAPLLCTVRPVPEDSKRICKGGRISSDIRIQLHWSGYGRKCGRFISGSANSKLVAFVARFTSRIFPESLHWKTKQTTKDFMIAHMAVRERRVWGLCLDTDLWNDGDEDVDTTNMARYQGSVGYQCFLQPMNMKYLRSRPLICKVERLDIWEYQDRRKVHRKG